MNLKKYRVTHTTIKEIDVTIDLDIYNQCFMDEFGTYMWEVDGIEEIVEHIARSKALDFDPEGVGSHKQWNETKEQALSKNGFIAEIIRTDEEQEINKGE